ncbi:hypothetical protein [Granulicoccus sp. GXG6511]|uniref:hypothetical protein n=1 Tax=Granulicoccus sp. GXG6511 TaxID=3381351 RepID=UPI003D7D883D
MLPAGEDDRSRDTAPDVTVAVAEFPDELCNPAGSSAVHQVNAEALLLRISDVGRYLVRGGREILIDPHPDATPHDLRVYLLGTCLGALLHQRGFLVLHASGVATDHGCVLFAGDSGSGKSTLLAEFLRRGYPMVVDDVCAVRVDQDGTPIVVPSYPRTRLWADAAERLAIDTSNLPRTKRSWDKFERQVPEQFSERDIPLTHLVHLAGPYDGYECVIEELSPIEAFPTVIHNTYRGILLDGLDRRATHFELAAQVAKSANILRVRRPAGLDSVEQLADLVLRRLQSREGLE